MKRVISLLLALVMMLSLCACGGSPVKKALVGSWSHTEVKNGGVLDVTTYVFKSNGKFQYLHSTNTEMNDYTGTYIINDDDTISIYAGDNKTDVKETLTYKYLTGVLTLKAGRTELKKITD